MNGTGASSLYIRRCVCIYIHIYIYVLFFIRKRHGITRTCLSAMNGSRVNANYEWIASGVGLWFRIHDPWIYILYIYMVIIHYVMACYLMTLRHYLNDVVRAILYVMLMISITKMCMKIIHLESHLRDDKLKSYAMSHHRTRSTVTQVMTCCLTAPSHYLDQYWLIIKEVFVGFTWRQFHGKCTRYIYPSYEFKNQ